ncbi:BgTH12-01472 [Blumeria graminis f. sp. triticale]|nr:BgTH12-01472 [Blumeria graminis f. sp. triticale]
MRSVRLSRYHGPRLCHLRPAQQHWLGFASSSKAPNALDTASSVSADEATSSFLSFASRPASSPYPSPLPQRAAHSAKLAALHARLSLPRRLPLETMARTLVDPSADSNPDFNNASLARLGGSLVSYYVGESLICTYPRLPISVLFAAAYAYNGPNTLELIAREWGVETAACPGSEVDPGLLQFAKLPPGTDLSQEGASSTRPDRQSYFRRGMTSRLVYDDEFGDKIPRAGVETAPLPSNAAHARFVKAVIGALYLHAGQEASKTFVLQHILSRHLDVSSLFQFQNPIRELARLCNRENFELPVARIISESGRWSRSPVYIVGVYSGADLLGTGSGASLPEARIRGCVAALKSWYLYSPVPCERSPSMMEDPSNKTEWKPVHIDHGEIVLS